MEMEDLGLELVGDSYIACPRCGNWETHQGSPIVFDRKQDYEYVIVRDQNTTREVLNKESNNPSPRRHGLTIPFACENCGGGMSLHIFQHKGATMVRWTIDGEGDSLKAERDVDALYATLTETTMRESK